MRPGCGHGAPGPTDEFHRSPRSTGYDPSTDLETPVTTPAHPGRTLFVSLPVSDLDRSREFYLALGFTLDPAMTDATAARLLVGEQATLMLLDHDTFAERSHRPVADAATHALSLFSFTVPSRDDVDAVAAAAVAAGGVEADGLEDFGFMCTRSFFDPDGHGWQVAWMADAAAGS